MYCPLCLTEFSVAETDVGKSVVCPGCQVPVLVENKTLLLDCPECGKPLSVESWMIGEEAICPECGKDIVLHFPKEKDPEEPPTGQENINYSEETLLPGETLGNYQVIRCLGIGGMGEVYLVRHTEMGTVCALKLLKPEVGAKNPVFSERLIREAKIAAKLQHPNLIRVLDAHRDIRNNCSYIVMEYVDGNTVGDMIKQRGALPEAMVLTIAKSVTSVLVTAEANGIVHRDIKPSNIMLTRDGQVKLADMGIAKVSNEDIGNTLTQGNSVLGTPNYASPEQLRNSHKVDTRSDIYSLGATMFHMLTGDMPFGGETIFSIISNVLEKDLPSVLEINPKISQGTALLVDRMLSKDQSMRPASAQELMRLLEGIDTTQIASEGQIRKLVQKKKKSHSAEAEGTGKKERPLWLKIIRVVVAVLLLAFIAVYGFKSYELIDRMANRSVQLSGEEVKELVRNPSFRKIRKAVYAEETGTRNEQALLTAAFREGNIEFLDAMDREKCLPHLEQDSMIARSLLLDAVKEEKAELVRWILKKYPNIAISIQYNAVRPGGKTAAQPCRGNLEKVRFFTECGGKLENTEDLIRQIVRFDPSPELFDFCLKNGMSLEWKERRGTLLTCILTTAHTDVLLAWLLRNSLITPEMLDLQLVQELGWGFRCMERLLEAGFDPLSRTAEGEPFLTFAIREGMRSDNVQKMIRSCKKIPSGGGKSSPLHAAVLRKDAFIIKALLQKGVKPSEETLLAASPEIRRMLEGNEKPAASRPRSSGAKAPEFRKVPKSTSVAVSPAPAAVPAEVREEQPQTGFRLPVPEKSPRTLEERLAAAKMRYEYCTAHASTEHEKQMLKVFKAQVATLEKFIRQREWLRSRPKKIYDERATKQFQDAVQGYLTKKNVSMDITNVDIMFADKLIGMLQSVRVDPDAPLREPGKSDSRTLEEILSRHDCFAKPDQILHAWLKRIPQSIPYMKLVSSNSRQNAALAKIKLEYPLEDPGRGTLHAFLHDRDTVQKLILAGVDLEEKDAGGRTPLLQAIHGFSGSMGRGVMSFGSKKINRIPVVQDLLQSGADPNAADVNGRTALHYAEAMAEPEIVRLLREAGADENRQDRFGRKPADCRIQKYFVDAVMARDESGVRDAVKKGASPDWEAGFPVPPLCYAVITRKYAVAKVLLSDEIEQKETEKSNGRYFYNVKSFALLAMINGFGRLDADGWTVADQLIRKRKAETGFSPSLGFSRYLSHSSGESERRHLCQFLIRNKEYFSDMERNQIRSFIERLKQMGYRKEAEQLQKAFPAGVTHLPLLN